MNRPAESSRPRDPRSAQLFAQALQEPGRSSVRPIVQTPAAPNVAKRTSIALAVLIGGVLLAGIGVALLAWRAEADLRAAPPAVARPVVQVASATLPAPETREDRLAAARAALSQKLAGSGFEARVAPAWTDSAVVLQAALNPSEVAKFERLLAEFTQDFGDMVKASLEVKSVWSLLPFRVREVVPGAGGWIVTQAGERVMVGGRIGGYTVSVIGPDKLVFEGPRRVEIEL